MIAGKEVAGVAGLHAFHQLGHALADRLPIVRLQDAHVEPADEGQPVAVLLGERERVAAGLALHRLKRVKPRVDDDRHALRHVAAGVQDHLAALDRGRTRRSRRRTGRISLRSTARRGDQPVLVAQVFIEPDAIGEAELVEERVEVRLEEIGVDAVEVLDPARVEEQALVHADVAQALAQDLPDEEVPVVRPLALLPGVLAFRPVLGQGAALDGAAPQAVSI